MAASVRPARSLAPPSLQLLHAEPGAVAEFQLQNILILVWHGQPTAELITRLELANESVRLRATHGMSMIHVVHAPLRLPDDSARTAMVRFVKSHNIRVVGMVVQQTGFVLSMLRSVVTGLNVLTPARFDFKICSSFEQVADWLPSSLFDKTGVEVDAERLLSALRDADERAK